MTLIQKDVKDVRIFNLSLLNLISLVIYLERSTKFFVLHQIWVKKLGPTNSLFRYYTYVTTPYVSLPLQLLILI